VTNAKNMSVGVINYGGIITSIKCRTATQRRHVVLGFRDIDSYVARTLISA